MEAISQLSVILNSYEYEHAYLITGNPSAGKKTLIHYLMGKGLEPDVSDDGQEVLNILEEA